MSIATESFEKPANVDSAPPDGPKRVSPPRLNASLITKVDASPSGTRGRDNSPLPKSIMGGSIVETEDSEYNPKAGGNQGVSNHYEVPNLSSMLYQFTNAEQERITQSFRIGNFQSLRDLPRHLLPGNISDFSRSKIQSNLYRPVEERTYVELQNGGGYFSKFTYSADEYGAFLEKQKEERIIKVNKQVAVHGEQKPFVTMPKKENIYKHQNAFPSYMWTKDDEQNTIGFLSENDPYEANAFEVLRARWINDSKKLYGEFNPSTGSRDLKKVNKQKLPDMVAYIKRRLLTDWCDINFIIGTNPEDYIELRFSLSSLDAPQGLKAYMGTLVDQDDRMVEYQLRKIAQYWGFRPGGKKGHSTSPSKRGNGQGDSPGSPERNQTVSGQSQSDDFVYYMIGPSWARHREPILYLQQFSN